MSDTKTATVDAATFERAKVMFMRLITCVQGLGFLLRGSMLTRTATSSNLRAIATEFTGKKYPAGQKGLQAAHDELDALKKRVLADRAAGNDAAVAVVMKPVNDRQPAAD